VDTGGVVSRYTSVVAREGGRYWIVEYRVMDGREVTLPASSSRSSPDMPTTECAGLLTLAETVDVLDMFVPPLKRLAVVRERVIDCRPEVDNGELSWASSALCCAALVCCLWFNC